MTLLAVLLLLIAVVCLYREAIYQHVHSITAVLLILVAIRMSGLQVPMQIQMPAETAMTFDPLLCASLHNQIIALLAPQAAEYNNRVVHNFFVAYDVEAEEIRDRLSQPLVVFLENIDILISDEEGPSEVMNFTPHLAMPNPNKFWTLNGGLPNIHGDDHENWITLYLGMFHVNGNFCVESGITSIWSFHWQGTWQ